MTAPRPTATDLAASITTEAIAIAKKSSSAEVDARAATIEVLAAQIPIAIPPIIERRGGRDRREQGADTMHQQTRRLINRRGMLPIPPRAFTRLEVVNIRDAVLDPGETEQVSLYRVRDANALLGTAELRELVDSPNWTTSNATLATVAADGTLTGAGAAGIVTISGADPAHPELPAASKNFQVFATQIPTSLAITPNPISLTVGGFVDLAITTYDQATPPRPILNRTYTVTALDNHETAAGLRVTGAVAGQGAVRVQDTTDGPGGLTQDVVVGVTPVSATPDHIDLSPLTFTLIVGGAGQQLLANVIDSLNQIMSGRTIAWSTLDAGTATVDAFGFVSAVAAGACQIRAEDVAAGLVAFATATVTNASPSLTLRLPTGPLFVTTGASAAHTYQIVPVTVDAAGNPVAGQSYSYASSSSSSASVSAGGLVTGLVDASGITITVTNTTSGLVGTITFNVITLAVNESPSPTGREPLAGSWSRERQYVMERMRNENHPWYGLIRQYKDQPQHTTNTAFCAAVEYQITGSATYGDLAVAHFMPYITALRTNGISGTNYLRGASYARDLITFDWARPRMTPDQVATCVDFLNFCAGYLLNRGSDGSYVNRHGNAVIRTTDSDEVCPAFWVAVKTDVLTKDVNPLGNNYWTNATNAAKPTLVPIGGLIATNVGPNDVLTCRNTVKTLFAENCFGGEWCSSSEYDPAEIFDNLTSWDLVTRALGVDHFPEIADWAQQCTDVMNMYIPPSQNFWVEYGDVQSFIRLSYNPMENGNERWSTWLTVAGLLRNTPQGAKLLDLALDVAAVRGYGASAGVYPHNEAFPYLDPYATRGDKDTFPQTKLCGQVGTTYGNGTLFVRRGTSQAIFWTKNRDRPIDHNVLGGRGTWELIRNGQYPICTRISYNGLIGLPRMHNVVIPFGMTKLGGMQELVMGQWTGADWAAIRVKNYGHYWDPTTAAPNRPDFQRSWIREWIYAHLATGEDVVGVRDICDMDDPKFLPNYGVRLSSAQIAAGYNDGRYPAGAWGLDDYLAIEANRDGAYHNQRCQTLPVQVSPTKWQWTDDAGGAVSSEYFYPSSLSFTVIDEKAVPVGTIVDVDNSYSLNTSGANIGLPTNPSETRYSLQAHKGPWATPRTFLQLVVAGNNSLAVSAPSDSVINLPGGRQMRFDANLAVT